ncbi:MAG: caspase family protein [Cyanobacteria bacterium P01_D01_bin.56]
MARYALVIGVALYENFSNLPKAAADAEAIASLLERHDYTVTRVPKRSVSGHENHLTIAPDKKVSYSNLTNELRLFLTERAKHQEVIIYIAAHGFQVVDLLTGEKDSYLATSNAQKYDGRNGIRFNSLNALIHSSEPSSLVLFMDCCYAGALTKESSFLEPIQNTINTKRNSCLIAACQDFERAREGANHGIFTAAILEGLSPSKAIKGKITSSYLFAFLSRELQTSGQEVVQAGMGRDIALINFHTTEAIVTTVDETCPYQGLKPFDRSNAPLFFGRREQVQKLLTTLLEKTTFFIPLIGASGSGKSSVVRAGLIPELENLGWQVLEPIKPGFDPIAQLKVAIQSFFRDQGALSHLSEVYPRIETEGLRPIVENWPGTDRALLVVDQFEEVFTLCKNESDRRRFIEWLAQVVGISSILSVVITVRADFLEDCLDYRSLAQIIQDCKIIIMPMAEAEVIDAIVKPAEIHGYKLGEGLLDLILRDVKQEKNCLPLLQFALTELWQHRDTQHHQLTVDQYREIGGLTGALNLHAEKLFRELTESQQNWVQRICLQLVHTGRETKDTRRQQPKQYLLDLTENLQERQYGIDVVLQKLIEQRLLVIDEEKGEARIDLAHEALMEGWSRFAEWRQENRELRQLCERINEELNDWLEHSQSDNFLMSGGRLTQIARRWKELKPNLTIQAHEFYQLSYLKEQANSSFQANVETFKEWLQELQEQLSTRLKILDRKSVKVDEKTNLNAAYESQARQLQMDIQTFQNKVEHFEERMQASYIAAIWIAERQDILIELMVQAAINYHPEIIGQEGAPSSSASLQKLYQEMDKYLIWLIDSLRNGSRLDEQLDIGFPFPTTAYTKAFKAIQQNLQLEEISSPAAYELQRYLKFLITYFRYYG